MKTNEPDIKKSIQSSIDRILVPVDYSDCSLLACKYAVRLAHMTGCSSIRIMHTFYSPAFDLIEFTTKHERDKLKKEIFESEREEKTKMLEDFISEVRTATEKEGFTGIDLSADIVPGIPRDEILVYSNQYNPDLIIMGTKGKNKETAIMGSVTEKIIFKESRPVLAIPEDYVFVGKHKLNDIIYVTEFDESDFLTLKILNEGIWPGDFMLHFVHICKSPDSQVEMKKLEGFRQYFETNYPALNFSVYSFDNKDFLTRLDELILQRQIKLIAVKNFRKSLITRLFRGNITKRLFYHTTVPLLVFHG